MKKIPALVATALSAVLVTSVGVQTTSAAAVAAAADDSSSARRRQHGRRAGTTDGRLDQGARVEATDRAKGKGKGGRYNVPTGAYFNNPRGSWNTRLRIERQVMRAIKNTRKGAIIRIALYSFDRVPVAKALIAATQPRRARPDAAERPPGHQGDEDAARLASAPTSRRRDFIYKCHSGCRTDGRKRLLHTKFYTFTKTGSSK